MESTTADASAASETNTPSPGPTGSPIARGIECGLLFVVGPALIDMRVLSGMLIPMLLGFAVVVLVLLLRDRTFDRRRMWNWRGARRDLPRILVFFVIGAAAIAVFTFFIAPDRMLGFARGNPRLYATIMMLYPFFSVYPQELIYRVFFFQRYRVLFRHPAAMIVASGLAFGWAHIVLENWIAVALSTVGGLLFAWTYHRTRSALACSVEHALYGDFIWTIGLGWFFYAGSVGVSG